MTGQLRRPPVMKWLRLYHEARTDAKLESLPDEEFRVWFRLLCFANEQPERGVIAHFTPRLLAVEVAHGDIALLERTLSDLAELRIIETSCDAHAFLHWDARQFASDNVTARVLKHRGQLAPETETLLQRFTADSETLPESELETETDHREETPTEASVDAADADEAPADDSAPTARSSAPSAPSTPSSEAAPAARTPLFPLPARLPSETTERAYWERVMKDMPGKHRVPALVELARSKISLDAPPGSVAYARIGALAKKHTASLVAVWIIQAAGQHIAGDPLDYLTKLAGRQLEREAQTNGRNATYGRRPGAHVARTGQPKVGSKEYYELARAQGRH